MIAVADTHVVLWWYRDDPALPSWMASHLEAWQQRGERVGVSAISLWEIAKLAERGKIRLRATLEDFLEQLERDPLFEVVPLSVRVIAESTRLGPSFHRDPADQLIVATARVHGVRLLSVDERIQASGLVALLEPK